MVSERGGGVDQKQKNIYISPPEHDIKVAAYVKA